LPLGEKNLNKTKGNVKDKVVSCFISSQLLMMKLN